MASMNDEQLAQWRAKRTGKAVPTSSGDAALNGRNPDATPDNRSPILDIQVQNTDLALLMSNNNDTPPQNPPSSNHRDDELTSLQSQLAAANGRLGPVQRQLEELRAANEAAQRRMVELQSQLAEKEALEATMRAKQIAESFDPFEGMSKEEIDMLDPTAAEMIRRAARNAYTKAASNVKDPEALIHKALAERDARARDNYIRATAETLGLIKLGSDAKFNKFLEEDDAAGILLNTFVKAPDLDTARMLEPKVKLMLKRYGQTTGQGSRDPDPMDRLSQHLDRGRSNNGQTKNLSPAEVRQLTAKANQLARARRFKEADAIFAQINA